ncbi:MAG: YqeG family HAD IIIA-type phosphatase [Coriobacteriia bacterium]|nr:YqeG family HAD IIIA-type phosphatase [Coriobacteriia bacterium]
MSLLSPDLYYVSVNTIDLDELQRRGVRHLLLDLDNTLKPRDVSAVPSEVQEWVDMLPKRGMAACLVSNNWHGYVASIAEDIGLPIVAKALKPFPSAFRKGLQVLGATADSAAVVGDQVFTDVLGGNLLGMTTVLVQPQSRTDLPHTLLLRRIERHVLAGREPLA